MIKKTAVITGGLLLALITVSAGCPAPAQDIAPADFFQGKEVELAITSSPGTFNDLSARIIANHLARDTGANVIANTRKGAGGLGGMNYVYTAEPDGLTLATVASVKLISNKVMDEPVAEYELEDFSYLMSIDHQPYCFMVSPEGPYQSVADLQAAQDLIIGGGGPAGPTALGGLSIIKLLNLDAVVVTGFTGEANRAMAVERGGDSRLRLKHPQRQRQHRGGHGKAAVYNKHREDPAGPRGAGHHRAGQFKRPRPGHGQPVGNHLFRF